jgi:preprotein translocase subunit YajC
VRPSPGQLVSGTRVVLTGGLLEGRIGTLIAIEADEAEVQIGLMTTRVPVSALRLPPR